jgi:FtsH-binding integral membrane protein
MSGQDSMLKFDVWERTATDAPLLSDAAYNALIGAVLCWGFAVNWVLVRFVDTATLQDIHPVLFLLGYLACCLGGVYLFNSSKKPSVSFLGYNLVVFPFGLVLNIVISRYDPTLVLDAIRVTALVTVVMMALGTMFPAFFQRIHLALVIALFAVIVVELFQWFVLRIRQGWTDWAVALIFCGYVGYDWGRANRIPKTVDNAVDSAAAIYMDIVNLFIRILRILGRRRR